MTDHATAAIGIGANLGRRKLTIRQALRLLDKSPKINIVNVSTLIDTKPVGPADQSNYLNGAATLTTTLSARELLDVLLQIERSLGRDRSKQPRWGPRRIDLDLLLYGDIVLDEPGLTVPHPRMHERLFVLEPLAEIAPNAIHPGLSLSVSQLLQRFREDKTDAAPASSHRAFYD